MLSPPIFAKTFGNGKMKIWSFPKETLKCLINGLRRNSNNLHRVTEPFVFQHHYYEDCDECNCNDKINDICFKYSSAAYKQGKIYIPIKIVSCVSDIKHMFICELHLVQETCQNYHKRSQSRTCQCLVSVSKKLALPKVDKTSKNEENEIDSLKRCYKEVIKELISDVSVNPCAKRKLNDARSILEYCLKNNVSSTKIVSLLRELNSDNCSKTCTDWEQNQKCRHDEILSCDQREEESYKSHSEYPRSRTKKFKIVRTHTIENCPSCHEEIVSECTRSISPDLSPSEIQSRDQEMEHSVPSYGHKTSVTSTFNKDLKEIKTILSDILTVMEVNETASGKSFRIHSPDLLEQNSDVPKSKNTMDIFQTLLQHVSRSQSDPTKKADSGTIPYIEEVQSKYDPITETSREEIYRYLPQSIPVILNTKETSVVPTIDAYNDNLSTTFNNQELQLEPRNSRFTTERGRFTSSMLPTERNDKIESLPDSRGVTNIYYYINSDPGQIEANPEKQMENNTRKSENAALQAENCLKQYRNASRQTKNCFRQTEIHRRQIECPERLTEMHTKTENAIIQSGYFKEHSENLPRESDKHKRQTENYERMTENNSKRSENPIIQTESPQRQSDIPKRHTEYYESHIKRSENPIIQMESFRGQTENHPRQSDKHKRQTEYNERMAENTIIQTENFRGQTESPQRPSDKHKQREEHREKVSENHIKKTENLTRQSDKYKEPAALPEDGTENAPITSEKSLRPSDNTKVPVENITKQNGDPEPETDNTTNQTSISTKQSANSKNSKRKRDKSRPTKKTSKDQSGEKNLSSDDSKDDLLSGHSKDRDAKETVKRRDKLDAGKPRDKTLEPSEPKKHSKKKKKTSVDAQT